MLNLSLPQVTNRLDCHMDSPSQCIDRLEHLSADVLDNHVTEQDVDTRPDKDDRQPDLEYLLKEYSLELIGTIPDPFLVKEQVVLIFYLCDLCL